MQAKMLMAAAQKRPSDGVNTGQKLCLEHGSNIQTLHTGHSEEQRLVSCQRPHCWLPQVRLFAVGRKEIRGPAEDSALHSSMQVKSGFGA